MRFIMLVLLASTLCAVDTKAPSQPRDVVATAVTSHQVSVQWTASTDNVGVINYVVWARNSTENVELMTNGPETGGLSFEDALTPSHTYAITVVAGDAAGNLSKASKAFSLTMPPKLDNEPPTAPSNPAIQVATNSELILTFGASTDNVGVMRYEIFVNGALQQGGLGTRWDFTWLTPGATYSYKVRAVDADLNYSGFSAEVTATLPINPDTQAPSVPGMPTATIISSTEIVLDWPASTDDFAIRQYRISGLGTFTDASGLHLNIVTAASATNSRDIPGLTGGYLYSFTLTAVDYSGNESASSQAVDVLMPVAN